VEEIPPSRQKKDFAVSTSFQKKRGRFDCLLEDF
jgi:hypothetical protein